MFMQKSDKLIIKDCIIFLNFFTILYYTCLKIIVPFVSRICENNVDIKDGR